MKFILFTATLCFILLNLTSHTLFARTMKLTCNLNPLSSQEKVQLEKKIKQSSAYQSIAKLNPSKLNIELNRCNDISGNVHISFVAFANIINKKCSINSMDFPLQFIGDEVSFKRIFFTNPIDPQFLTRPLLQAALEKIALNPQVNSFFKKNNFCQIEYQNQGNDASWVIQLRDQDKKNCFIRSNLDGSTVSIIKRLYARNSQCGE